MKRVIEILFKVIKQQGELTQLKDNILIKGEQDKGVCWSGWHFPEKISY